MLHYLYILHYNLRSFARIVSRLTSLSPYIHTYILHLPCPTNPTLAVAPKTTLPFLLYPYPYPHPHQNKRKEKKKKKKHHQLTYHPSFTGGKGGKGLGKGGAKRHRKILRDNIQGITKPAIRRLARRGGVKRISASQSSLKPPFSTFFPFYPFFSPFIPFFHHSLTHSLHFLYPTYLPTYLPTLNIIIIISLTYIHTSIHNIQYPPFFLLFLLSQPWLTRNIRVL